MNTPGLFRRWRTRLFGERDQVADQLKDIARQGSSMARLAHLAALLLILLFSAGSLVALGGDALTSIIAGWQTGHVDVPAAISIAVSTLLVLCMDTALVYAASMVRLLNTRRAQPSEKRLHQLVMLTVALLEAGTYLYMSATYEHPVAWAAWVLIAARAAAAPLLATYLSLARPLPVTSRDILAQVELASGYGVIRDAVQIANDASAPLGTKAALFGASALMQPEDRARLDQLIAVTSTAQESTPAQAPSRAPRSGSTEQSSSADVPPKTRRKPPVKTRISRVLVKHPNASLNDIARLAEVSKSTAARHRDQLTA